MRYSMLFSNRKGQSALEYLMTYGWGLVVVGVVIAALALLYVNPGNIAAGSTTGFSGQSIIILNSSYPANSTAPLTLIVSNQSGRILSNVTITITNAAITGTTTSDNGTSPVRLKAGESAKLFFQPSISWLSGTNSLDVKITAQDPDQFNKVSMGKINFTISTAGTLTPACTFSLSPSALTVPPNAPSDIQNISFQNLPDGVVSFSSANCGTTGVTSTNNITSCTPSVGGAPGSCAGTVQCGNYSAAGMPTVSLTLSTGGGSGNVSCSQILTVTGPPACYFSYPNQTKDKSQNADFTLFTYFGFTPTGTDPASTCGGGSTVSTNCSNGTCTVTCNYSGIEPGLAGMTGFNPIIKLLGGPTGNCMDESVALGNKIIVGTNLTDTASFQEFVPSGKCVVGAINNPAICNFFAVNPADINGSPILLDSSGLYFLNKNFQSDGNYMIEIKKDNVTLDCKRDSTRFTLDPLKDGNYGIRISGDATVQFTDINVQHCDIISDGVTDTGFGIYAIGQSTGSGPYINKVNLVDNKIYQRTSGSNVGVFVTNAVNVLIKDSLIESKSKGIQMNNVNPVAGSLTNIASNTIQIPNPFLTIAAQGILASNGTFPSSFWIKNNTITITPSYALSSGIQSTTFSSSDVNVSYNSITFAAGNGGPSGGISSGIRWGTSSNVVTCSIENNTIQMEDSPSFPQRGISGTANGTNCKIRDNVITLNGADNNTLHKDFGLLILAGTNMTITGNQLNWGTNAGGTNDQTISIGNTTSSGLGLIATSTISGNIYLGGNLDMNVNGNAATVIGGTGINANTCGNLQCYFCSVGGGCSGSTVTNNICTSTAFPSNCQP